MEIIISVFRPPEQWAKMRAEARQFWYVDDVDAFAAKHYERWPYTPLDLFDITLWSHPELKRILNQSVAKHIRANNAVSPNGQITRLMARLVIPTFFTISLVDLGFSINAAKARNYQNRELIDKIKEVLKNRVTGSAWFSVEASRKGLIHVHVLAEHDALPFDAYSTLIYNPRDLYRYLIKGIPYNSLNLATYFKGKKVLLEEGKERLVYKSGKIRIPNSIQA